MEKEEDKDDDKGDIIAQMKRSSREREREGLTHHQPPPPPPRERERERDKEGVEIYKMEKRRKF